MAIPTNTFTAFSAIGNREDLSDIIYNIAPTETPVLSLAKRATATSTLHEWQTDTLAAAGANAAIEGDDAVGNAITATVRAQNRTQISQKTVITSGTQNAVKTAGRDKEQAYQKMKAAKELKRDMEFVLTNNQAPVVGNTTTARALRPLESWYATNTSRGAGGANGSTTTAATDGTQRAFTETLLKPVLQAVFNAGGNPDVLLVGGLNKQAFSAFTGNSTSFRDSGEQKLFAAVDVYVSDFGELKVIPSRFSRNRTAHVLDTEYLAVAYLRDFAFSPLAKTGDSEKDQIVVEYTLEMRSEAAHGVVADLT